MSAAKKKKKLSQLEYSVLLPFVFPQLNWPKAHTRLYPFRPHIVIRTWIFIAEISGSTEGSKLSGTVPSALCPIVQRFRLYFFLLNNRYHVFPVRSGIYLFMYECTMIAGIEFDLPEEHICHIHMHVGVSVGRIHTCFCGASTLVAPNGYGIRYWVFFCGQNWYCGFEIGHRNL